jgi:hypothetical protein
LFVRQLQELRHGNHGLRAHGLSIQSYGITDNTTCDGSVGEQ